MTRDDREQERECALPHYHENTSNSPGKAKPPEKAEQGHDTYI